MKRLTMVNFASCQNGNLRSWAGLLILIVLCHISASGWAWGDSLASKNNEGNKLYKNGKVDEALSKWRDAQIENPDNDKLHYNIGNGLHEQKKYEGAFKEYEKSLNSKDTELLSNAYYNIGNTHYRMGKLLEAIEDYKKCLGINPKDEDAKYNIEFIEKKLKEQSKKENQQGDQKQSEAEKEQKEGHAKEDKKAGEEEKREEQQKSSGEEKRDEMSKEDAVRLLDALKDDEKDVQKELKNQPIEGQYRVDKDW